MSSYLWNTLVLECEFPPFVTWQHLDSSSSRGDGNLLSPPARFEPNRFDIFIFTVLSINGAKEETSGACLRREEEEEEEEEEKG